MSSSRGLPKGTFPNRRPLFYYITDRSQLSGKPLLPVARDAIGWGVDFVQIREKDLPDKELFELTGRVLALAGGTRSRVLVNGRADVALAAGAHGVHLPSAGLSVSDLKRWLPANFLVGVSVHSLREARRAHREGADYLLLGPIFETPSKQPYGPPLGLRCLRRACKALPLPVLALGGMHAGTISSVLRSGASGVAGISMFQRELVRLMPSRAALVESLQKF